MLNKENNKYQEYSEHENVNGKFQLQFTIIWLAFMTFFTIITILSGSQIGLIPAIIIIGFWILGIKMFKSALAKIKADKDTDQFGEECFGKICGIRSTGRANGNLYYTAKIVAYIPSEESAKVFKEDIGFDCKFPQDGYLKLKHYENDVNIKGVVDSNYIPERVKNSIDQLVENELAENEFDEEILDEMEMYDYETNSNTNNNAEIFSSISSIIFGIIWLLITAVCTWGFYGNIGGTITVNGEQVSQEEFNAMLGPKLFIGIFWVVGIIFIIAGIVNIIKSISEKENNDFLKSEIPEKNVKFDNYHYNEFEESDDDDPIKKL